MPHTLPQVCLAPSANVGAGTVMTLAGSVVSSNRLDTGGRAPVDIAFDSLLVVTRLAVAASSEWHPQHGLILSASAVAAAEDYFRSILTLCVSVCSYCEDRVRPLETRMEHVFSGSVDGAVRGMLDSESLSSRENVLSWTKKVTGQDLSRSVSLDTTMREFERACHIRHSAVHAGGYVSSRAARILGVASGSWISFSSPTAIHEFVSVVASTIRAYNQSLFSGLLGRWIDDSFLSGIWAEDRVAFESLWRAFRSEKDIESDRIAGGKVIKQSAYNAYRAVRPLIESRVAAH